MVKTWSREDSGDEVCEDCGSVYAVAIQAYPLRDKDTFNCQVCGNLMSEWNSTQVPEFTLKTASKTPNK